MWDNPITELSVNGLVCSDRSINDVRSNQTAISPTTIPTNAQIKTVRPVCKVSPSAGTQKRNHFHDFCPLCCRSASPGRTSLSLLIG